MPDWLAIWQLKDETHHLGRNRAIPKIVMNEYREVEQRVSMGFTNYPHSGYRNYLPEKHGIFLEMHYV